MSFERGERSEGPEVGASAPASAAPGKRPRVDPAVVQQRRSSSAGDAGAPPPRQLLSGPAPAHEDPFAVHQLAERGVSGGSTALPHGDAIQRSFGRHDVSGVQAHTDGTANGAVTQMGAEAFASGNHVAFAGASPSLHTAAHEAAHIVQQRAGVHLKGGVGEVGDTYERHADEVADAVVAGRSAESLLDRHAPADGAAASSPSSGVQMYIEIGPIGEGREVANVEEAWQGIMRACAENADPKKVLPQLRAREVQARATLKEWHDSPGEKMASGRAFVKTLNSEPQQGPPSQWRKYRDFYELGIAVAYETDPIVVENKAYEGQLACVVANDSEINGGLNLVKIKVLTALHEKCAAKFETFASELDGGAVFSLGKFRGSYRQIGSYKEGGMALNVVNFLEAISDSFETNIAVIHDMIEHLSGPKAGAKPGLGTSLGGQVPEPRDAAYETTLLKNPEDEREGLERRTRRKAPKAEGEEGAIDKTGMKGRNNVGTRDVTDIDTITGMVMKAPMLAGKSMTTARMMELVEWAGGSAWDKIVVAWSIFAYWKHHYPASTVPFHTFHEVMDIARNYGVPYRPFFYPDLDKGAIDYTSGGTKPFNPDKPMDVA
ncbi:MAG TPA: DUF4157 domain-containing protein [Kofleriaceae bacterium]|nr:DUF4157 domain-containing protein [Kofleriaceae bacterium]